MRASWVTRRGFLLCPRRLSHLARLVLGLYRCNAMNNKVTLGVTDQMEVLSGPVDLMTSVTVAGWVTPVQTLLSISTKAASALRYFIPRKGIFRLLLREMRGGRRSLSLRWMDEEHTAPSVYPHPVLCCRYVLHMLLGATRHGCAGHGNS